MTETRDIDIPENALTTCPDRGYQMVSLLNVCIVCPHSLGLAQVRGENGTFSEKFRVRCAIPQMREIVEFVK